MAEDNFTVCFNLSHNDKTKFIFDIRKAFLNKCLGVMSAGLAWVKQLGQCQSLIVNF